MKHPIRGWCELLSKCGQRGVRETVDHSDQSDTLRHDLQTARTRILVEGCATCEQCNRDVKTGEILLMYNF